MPAPTHESAERAECPLSRRFTEETSPYPLWSERLVGTSGWGKTISSVFRICVMQTRGAKAEGRRLMKEDGATKTSDDKARAIIRDRVTMKPNTWESFGSAVPSVASDVGVWVRSCATRGKAESDGEGDEELEEA
ncbi:hypothetical protein BS47DRAFT_1362264 [Hydnum rufescens UP504]|uniref:Uncharacterized protein n=1 Tax=Hydnum rufescens UP504 TaxID=1448309 RepID=A0A9P6DWJ1_9AGAM|nr:hypothetical protein BS47DRAFT_1362264 [Hydnum rufescens UP504]